MKRVFYAFFCLKSLFLFAQAENNLSKPTEKYHLSAKKTASAILLDGVLDEQMWLQAEVAKDFWQKFPFDSSFAKIKTEARIAYDKDFIYVAITCYHAENQGLNQYLATTLKRDFEPETNDMAAVYFDTFLDQTNGFAFGTTPYGVQREGLVANGGSDGVFAEWDNKWYLETKRYEDKWIAEMAIPFKSLRFKAGSQQWRIQFYRQDLKNNEQSTWTKAPRNFGPAVMSFYGDLDFEEPLSATGSNVSLIPYLAGNANTDWINEQPTKYEGSLGLDAKVAVTSSLNLDLTVNPDFSNVEADVQQSNLSRFELFFPERRQFFLENSDMFAQIGYPGIRPFFSRRIGIYYDEQQGLYRQNKILFGARLSGKVDENWRLGLLTMQSQKTPTEGTTNYSVAVLQRKVFTRSNVSAFVVNKQVFGDEKGFSWRSPHANRVVGVEYGLFSKNNKWNGDFFVHRSFTDDDQKPNQMAAAGFIAYDTPAFALETALNYVGENYNPEVGFAPRKGYIQHFINPRWGYFPKNPKISKVINNHGFGFNNVLIINANSQLTDTAGITLGNKLIDRESIIFYYFNFLNTTQFNVYAGNFYTYLFNAFDPTNNGGLALPAGGGYAYSFAGFEFQSNNRKSFVYTLNGEYGSYFNGNLLFGRFEAGYRMQPYGTFSVSGTISDIKLPKPYNSTTLLLIGPRVDLSFNRKLFWTTFLQYNSQINNINVNSRLQWRFKPVSDVFFVYTDNYFASDETIKFSGGRETLFRAYQPKNRAFVLKITYWLNL
ncbi:MAG: carbohydrate binding family 9 domain-containing protein [Verrucomicrobia bacterium]|nr:carbohydrate binding family 9 domain-containing protein [Cytophagales bacterium]